MRIKYQYAPPERKEVKVSNREKVSMTALAEVWVKEKRGKEHESRIIEYHQSTTLKATEDEIAWCSSFVNWVCMQNSLERTKSAAARSWLKIGTVVPGYTPKPFDIVVFKRGPNPWQGHVAFYLTEKDGKIYCLGGNQGNAVSIKPYNTKDLLKVIDIDALSEV